jgi:hypothetical protein
MHGSGEKNFQKRLQMISREFQHNTRQIIVDSNFPLAMENFASRD